MSDGKVIIDSELNDKNLEQGLSNLQGKMASAGKKMQGVGKDLTKSLTLPIVAAGTGALLMAADFDDSMRTVKATMGTNLGSSTAEADKNFKALRDEAMKLGATTSHSAKDASGAMKELAQMGYDTNQVLASTGTVLDVASASGLELDFVAATLAGSMNQFGVEVDDNGVNIKRFGDVMVRAGQMSGTSMDEIAGALEQVGSSAYNMGMDIEQTSAYIGILGDNSISSGKAGTSLNAMFRDMKDKVVDGNLAFGEFDVAMYDANGNMRDMTDIMVDVESGLDGMNDEQKAAAINAVFGTQAQTALNAILGQGTDKVREYEQDLRLANDTAKIAAGEMEGGIGGALRGLASATEALAITFGDILAPTVKKLAQFVANLFLKFTELGEGQKKAIVIVAAFLSAIGPVLLVLGTMVGAISNVIGALALITPPVMLAVAALAAIVAIGVKVYQNWDTIKAKAIEVFSNFSPLLDTVKAAFQSLKDSVGPITESLKTLWESLTPVLEVIAAVVGGVLVAAFGIIVSTFTAVTAALGPLINGFINFMDFIVNMANVVIALFKGDLSGAFDYWMQAGQSAIDMFVNIFGGLIEFVSTFVTTIVDFFHGLYMTLVGNSIIPDMINAIVDWFNNMVQWVVDIVTGFIDLVVAGFNMLLDGITTIFNAVKTVITTVWNAVKTVITTVVNAIFTAVTTIFNNMKNGIVIVFNAIRTVITTVWNSIRTVITTVVNGIRTVVTSVFNAVRSVITSVMNGIRSTITSVWNGIRNIITSVSNGIRSTISGVFGALAGIVRGAMSGVKSAVSGGMSGALGAVTGIMGRFKTAGSNIAGSIADGIKGAISKVTGAMSNLASKARDMLPFSPAKEGPLKDLDKLDFGGPIGDSLDKAIPDVQAQMNTMLKAPNFGHSGNKSAAVTNDDKVIVNSDPEIKKLLKQLVAKDSNLYVDKEKLGSTMDKEQARRIKLLEGWVALD